MRVPVINCPSKNMPGIRQPEICGKTSYASLKAMIAAEADRLGAAADFFRSNHERRRRRPFGC